MIYFSHRLPRVFLAIIFIISFSLSLQIGPRELVSGSNFPHPLLILCRGPRPLWRWLLSSQSSVLQGLVGQDQVVFPGGTVPRLIFPEGGRARSLPARQQQCRVFQIGTSWHCDRRFVTHGWSIVMWILGFIFVLFNNSTIVCEFTINHDVY